MGDGDGSVSFEEFSRVSSEVKLAQLRGVFDEFDLDGDGRIDLVEMFTVLKNVLGVDDDDFVAGVATEIVLRAAESRTQDALSITFDEFVAALEYAMPTLQSV